MHDEALALLRDHVGRERTGRLTDPADLAAVVGVERLAAVLGTTEPDALEAALLAPPGEPGQPGQVAALRAEVLDRVVAGLRAREEGARGSSGLLNKDSGTHHVSPDAVLLRAAVRAAYTSFAAMPYYTVRYGARGQRFAGSDSAWLVSLAGRGGATAAGQVSWLAGVLAARGMPSWLLETHLGVLVEEVEASVGPGAAGSLEVAALWLRRRRRTVVTDALLEVAERDLDTALGPRQPVARAGALVAAAVADRLLDVAPDDSLLDWLTDPARTDPEAAGEVRRLRDALLVAADGAA